VTLSGTFGAAQQSFVATTADAASGRTVGTNKGLTQTDASINFAVAEDLGGGMKLTGAAQFANNALRGGNLTKEDSSVALSTSMGTITYANTRSANAAITANVFGSWMPVTSFYAGVDSRVDVDVLAYTTPELAPGLKASYASVEAVEGVGTSAAKIGQFTVNYANGPLVAVANFKNYNAAALSAGDKKSRSELAVTYDLGVAKVGVGSGSKLTDSGKTLTSYGVSVPMGAVTFGVNGAKRGDVKFYDAGVSYALSKRTSVNVMTGKLTGGAYAGSQSRVGIKHTF
jgi:hypothetical protein